ncbi:hypothetical protein ILYODFUR_010597 [Ilyodon furcidens]|uniref:SRCR domain-containing protein n=1 Tax=Ilyodon furcidens TaxID=33524 RepID=A0ABV0TUT2_9TELE
MISQLITESTQASMFCKAISYKSLSQDTSGILDHVECTGSESSLWHCRAKHHNNIRCSSVPYVVCSGSVNVKLVDGPGRCAGSLKVQHEDQWKTAISDKWEETFSAVLCKQLECGDSGKKSSKTLDKRISNFLTLSCKKGTQISDISECITDNKGTQGYDQVEITCEKHTVIFLEESKPCSGTVGIEYRNKTRWLSGSNQTWNQNVANMICQELHCGNASKFSSKPLKNQTSLLVESRTCSSSNKSLLQCDITEPQESDNNQTLAYVDCEGNITVTLTHGCWGKVNISTASKQGYVSQDAWTEAMSVQLCKELACQDKTLPTHNWLEETILTFKSLHALRIASKLSQYTLVDANTMLQQKPAYVVCKGSIKPRFKPSRDKCSGNVEVFYEGSWIPVHKDALENIDNQNTICEELNCGKAVTRIDYSGPLEVNHLISRLQCQKNTNSLATCQDVVVEKIEETLQTSKLTGLKCSEWSTMVLEVEHSCKGEVVVYSEGVNNQETKRSFVSSHGWREAEGERLCMDLKCGKYKLTENRIFSAEANSLWSQSFNCSSKPESIWQCEKKQTAISQENKLFLECEGEPEVVLSEKCTGKLTINGSPVCSSQWKTDYSHRVCQQLNCGNAIYFQQSGPPSTDSYHVDCDEHNYLIGQCKRVRGKCNSGFVSISCVGSVSFKTSEKCGGVLSIKYGKLPEEVCEPSISTELSNKLCQSLKCGPFEKIKGPSNQQTPKMQTSLACPSYYKDPRYCAKRESCPSPSIFTCKGYQPPTQPPSTQPPANPVPYIVGVLILLILVVLIVIFVRYQINRRNRKSMVPSDMEEADWDSGEYEDVDKDEMESFGHGRGFRSESEVQGEKDMDSNRSYNYDDIDEVTEAQPLTPQGSMVRATEDEDMHEDGVTYEVEDSQENYDDIDANPEDTETTAEVHDGPKPAPEGDAAAPKDQIQKD